MMGETNADIGHDKGKFKIDFDEHVMPSLVKEITKAKFEAHGLTSNAPNAGLIRVRNRTHNLDGYFAVGNAAADEGAQLQRERRYVPDVVGVLLCGAWAQHYAEGQPKFTQQRVTTMFPVADWHAVNELRHAVSGAWVIDILNGPQLRFSVPMKSLVAMPESIGGFLNKILDTHSNQRPEWRANGYNPIIVDAGAGTLQVVPLSLEYQPLDPDRIGFSYPLGVNEVVEEFIQDLYRLGVVGDVSGADRTIYRKQLQQGFWSLRGNSKLAADIQLAMAGVLGRYMRRAARYLSQHDFYGHSHVFFTGGGSGLMAYEFVRWLIPDEPLPDNLAELVDWAAHPQRRIIFCERLDEIHLANVRGARLGSNIT